MKGHYLLFAAAAIGLLCLAFYLGRTGQAPVKPAGAEAEQTSGYDFVARGVSVEQADEAGNRLYAFTAAEVRQQTGETQITARDLTLRYDPPAAQPEDGPGAATPAQHWTVRADTAQLPQQGSVVALAGNVQAQGVPPGAAATLVMHTDRLDYDMREQRLRTDQPVRFDWSGSELAGIGLDADLRRGRIELESEVRGRVAF